MPDGWEPVTDAFLDGLSLGIFVVLTAIAVLVVIASVRRVLGL